jgi:hypothetical protein
MKSHCASASARPPSGDDPTGEAADEEAFGDVAVARVRFSPTFCALMRVGFGEREVTRFKIAAGAWAHFGHT